MWCLLSWLSYHLCIANKEQRSCCWVSLFIYFYFCLRFSLFLSVLRFLQFLPVDSQAAISHNHTEQLVLVPLSSAGELETLFCFLSWDRGPMINMLHLTIVQLSKALRCISHYLVLSISSMSVCLQILEWWRDINFMFLCNITPKNNEHYNSEFNFNCLQNSHYLQ